jgi:molecular chaperone DnaK (HSP70)
MVSRAEFEEAAGTQIRVFRDKLGKLAEIQLKVPPEAIYLTGQGTKLYVLKQLIREVFPQVEVIDRYQENAVIRGLCHQLAIFEGFEHKLLMATLPGSLYILGSEQSDADIVIEPIRNPIKVKLLENDNTIPTRKSRIVTFAFAEGEELPKMFPVELLERTVSGKEYMLYSTFVTAEPGKQYELTVDIDANLRARVTLRGTETKTACVKTLL